MSKFLTLSVTCLWFYNLQAQVRIQETIVNQVFNIEYSISESGHSLIITDIGNNIEDEYETNFFTETTLFEYLRTSYNSHVDELQAINAPLTSAQETGLRQRTPLLYMRLVANAQIASQQTGENVAELILRSEVHLYNYRERSIGIKAFDVGAMANSFNIVSARLVFDNGFIQSISIRGRIDGNGEIITYSNKHPIGVSRRSNHNSFSKFHLFNANDENDMSYIYLGGVNGAIEYNANNNFNTNDYSPKNGAVEVFGGQSKELFRDVSTNLFELKVFTDFVGAKEENPNGLIQTEVNRHINLVTNRWYSLGAFTNVTPYIDILKIEENNRSVEADVLFINDTVSTSYLSPLELYRFRNFSAGFDFAFLDYDGESVYLSLDPVFGFHSTLMTTEIGRRNISSLSYGLDISVVFNPSPDFELLIKTGRQYFHSLDRSINYRSRSGDGLIDPVKTLMRTELQASYHTGESSSIYGRVVLNNEFNSDDFLEGLNNNFAQIQIGIRKKFSI